MTDTSGLKGNVDGHDGRDEWHSSVKERSNMRARRGMVKLQLNKNSIRRYLQSRCYYYPYTVQPSYFPSSLHHPSGVVFSWALINIPLLCFTILSFSSQINLNRSSMPSFAIILSVCTPQIFSCTKDGRNTHASVIQYHFQSHFEDSYEQAGRQAIEWWSSSQPVTTNCAALNQTTKKKKSRTTL